ncbi:NAD-dependent epimerase/dehydratase family protein [Nocardia jejuensis]|uniref:NAD-dependent epimerase/dehydratase family protein n=1 Tax=Nocardia jejuensis TaxID=328049 RepID=UPI0008305C5E|nr:NAD-dependent epimerase/dehydratase family protein [Nocardia jejuensis]
MRVLVVGASGYLGRAVGRVLSADGHRVVEMSRTGKPCHGTFVAGDAHSPGLGLDAEALGEVGDIEAVVCCIGSVDMGSDPAGVVNVHVNGTHNVLDFAASIDSVRRVVYVSSVLALGRASGTITNRDLSRGQSFRNWYEYAKYRGELIARRERRVPVSILRLGTLLGPAPAEVIPRHGGPVAALPHLLSGYPVALADCGRFPVYAADVDIAARVVRDLVVADEHRSACTYFDPERPTLAAVLERLCRPWGVFPKVVDSAGPAWIQRAVARRFGVQEDVVDYSRPLFEFDPSIFDSLPDPDIGSRTDYITETGVALRHSGLLRTPHALGDLRYDGPPALPPAGPGLLLSAAPGVPPSTPLPFSGPEVLR